MIKEVSDAVELIVTIFLLQQILVTSGPSSIQRYKMSTETSFAIGRDLNLELQMCDIPRYQLQEIDCDN